MRWLAAGLLILLAPSAAAASFDGAIRLDDVWTIQPDESLTFAPGTTVTGTGRIEVLGALSALGNATHAVELTVPVTIHPNATADLHHARLWAVHGTALTVRGGDLTIRNATFEANGIGLVASGGTVHARNVAFFDHASDGLRVLAPARAHLADATFARNLRGLSADLGLPGDPALTLDRCAFVDNDQHAVLDLGSDPAPLHVQFTACAFGRQRDGATEPGIRIRGDRDAPDDARIVELREATLERMDIALRIERGGFVARLDNATLRDNAIGLDAARGARALAHRAHFDNGHNVRADADAQVLLSDSTLIAREQAPGALVQDRAAPPWWPIVAIVAVGALAWRLRPRAPPAPEPAAPPPATDERAPLDVTPTEARILLDVADHPGTTQAACATRLGISRQALHYHVKKLATRGLLEKTQEGRVSKCRVPARIAAAVRASPTAVTHAPSPEKE